MFNIGVSRPIYVNVDTPNLGFPYFNFLGYHLKKHPVCRYIGGFFGHVVSPHDSDQMSQRSQVSRVTLQCCEDSDC